MRKGEALGKTRQCIAHQCWAAITLAPTDAMVNQVRSTGFSPNKLEWDIIYSFKSVLELHCLIILSAKLLKIILVQHLASFLSKHFSIATRSKLRLFLCIWKIYLIYFLLFYNLIVLYRILWAQFSLCLSLYSYAYAYSTNDYWTAFDAIKSPPNLVQRILD